MPSFRTRAALALVLALATAGCDSLTDVKAPDLVDPSKLDNPQGAIALHAGAITLFANGLNGGNSANNSFVTASGVLTDEFQHTGVGAQWDSHDIRNSSEDATGVGTSLVSLSQSRVAALAAVFKIRQVAPNPRSRLGELFGVAAYSELLLGEMYCSGVSLSVMQDGVPVDYGQPLTTPQLYDRSVADFDSAASYASDSARVLNMVRVGRGRALLDLGRFADAATAVAAVPTNYVYNAEYSATTLTNTLNRTFNDGVLTVSDKEGGNGLDFRSANDPRVRTAFLRRGADTQNDVYAITPLMTAGAGAPTPLATGVEARLIEAEAALQANNPT